jgi:serine/threonine-protein kinase
MVTSELGACEWFVWDLRRSNLIDRGQLDQVVGDFLKKNPRAEPPALSEYLVQQGVLSQFQADRILQGKTQGLVLGPYNLIDSIGQGSMGQVYKAVSKTDNQMYAVKVLPRRSMWNVRLARRQVRAFGQFQHPSVVPFVDVGTSGGQHYLVWPMAEGRTLDAIVQEQGKLTPEMTAWIGVQISNGLNICHQNGLFHGLLKPSNVMVSPSMDIKILDFGIGSLLVENEGESLVDTMSTANTLTSGLDCASPESIMEPTTRTPAGDQYSLGCVLYYCATGRYPFPEGSAVEKMMAHQTKSPQSVKDFVPEAPDTLCEVIERLMQKSPDARFAGADEVSEMLEPLAAAVQGGLGAPPTGKVRPQAAPAPAPLQRNAAAPTPFANPAPTPKANAGRQTLGNFTEPEAAAEPQPFPADAPPPFQPPAAAVPGFVPDVPKSSGGISIGVVVLLLLLVAGITAAVIFLMQQPAAK